MELHEEIAIRISNLHSRNKMMLKICDKHSIEIINLFLQAANISPDTFELVKHAVDCEGDDFLDVNNLLDDLKPVYRIHLLRLFKNVSPFVSYQYRTKVISDLDNTAIENAFVAPVPPGSKDKYPVKGFINLVNKLTMNGKTTVTFISARPRMIEKFSIINTIKKFRKEGLTNFVFEAGDLVGPIKLGVSYFNTNYTWESSLHLGKIKMNSYLRILNVYPSSRFIFFGDDTQGDYIFAAFLVNHNPKNIAIIRKISLNPISPHNIWDDSMFPNILNKHLVLNNPRIIYHNDSYEYVDRFLSTSSLLL